MAITGTDAYGPYTDTGVGTAPTVRTSVETEVHNTNETDSGSKLTLPVLILSHIPHREKNGPR